MSHLAPEQLVELRGRLDAERLRLLERQASEEAEVAAEDPRGDIQDKASDEARRTTAMQRHDQGEGRLQEVDAALQRMDAGTYGICEEMDEPIPYGRLQIEPTTRYTVEALEMLEQERIRDDNMAHGADDREAY